VGRYAQVGEALAAAGYALVGFDLRGHGRSGGARGHTPSYEALMDDMADFLGVLKARYRRLPVFLYGHSMGGNLVINFCLRRRPNVWGVIATAPWLQVAFEPPAWKIALARTMNRIAPGFTQKSGLETPALARDPEIVRKYASDPLVHDKISARLFMVMYESGLWALDRAHAFPLPLLLMHGTADRITSVKASRDFAKRAAKKVTWRAWDGWYHEIHNEPEAAQVIRVMIRWIGGRLKEK
jgi:alpha-beta hydrolase superfamily lysophospholipase